MDNSTSSDSYSTGANAIALPIFAALALAVTYTPLRMLYKVKNIPVCTLIIVIGIQNFFTLLNAILWPNNNQSTWWMGDGLCDIQVELKAPLFTALATSTACLTKSVADAVNINKTRFIQTRAMRQRKVLIECLFCFAVPVLQMILHYVVQANRYAIAPIYGCADVVDNSWPTIAILYAWPPIFALLNAYYAGKSLLS
jgi:pheromone a factor receptor